MIRLFKRFLKEQNGQGKKRINGAKVEAAAAEAEVQTWKYIFFTLWQNKIGDGWEFSIHHTTCKGTDHARLLNMATA